MYTPDIIPKEYHRICKRFFCGKQQSAIPPLIESDYFVYFDSTSKANILNDYFADSSTLVDPPDLMAILSLDRNLSSLIGGNI